jgi:hypothetical protein
MDFQYLCFDENYKTNITEYILFQYSLIAFGQNKIHYFLTLKNRNQKIDSLINFNTDKNKLQYLAVLPSINYNF